MMLTCLAMKPLCLFEGGPSSEPCVSIAGLPSSRSAMLDYRYYRGIAELSGEEWQTPAVARAEISVMLR